MAQGKEANGDKGIFFDLLYNNCIYLVYSLESPR